MLNLHFTFGSLSTIVSGSTGFSLGSICSRSSVLSWQSIVAILTIFTICTRNTIQTVVSVRTGCSLLSLRTGRSLIKQVN